MMESVAFNDSHIVEEEDYVFVNENDMDMNMDVDGEYCYEDDDDFVVFTSPSIVGRDDFQTEISSKQLHTSSSVISLEGCDENLTEEMEDLLMKLESSPGDNLSEFEGLSDDKSDTEPEISVDRGNSPAEQSSSQKDAQRKDLDIKQETNSCGSRLSNKKRRKRLKLQKKAQAAAEAAANLAAMRANPSLPTSSSKASRPKKSKLTKSKKVHNSASVAVGCVTESLSEYREKHNIL